MQVHRFDPFTVLARLDREFDELVRRGWSSAGEQSGSKAAAPVARRMAAGFVPAVEVARDGEDVVVRVELPGIDVEKDVSIEVERGKLVISGEKRDMRSEDHEGLLVRELRYGQFRREFALPPGVSPEQVEASYDAGMLDVRVRSVVAPEPQPVRVPITTSGRQVVEHEQAPQAVAAGETESV